MSRLPEKLKSIRWLLIGPFLFLGLLVVAYALWWINLADRVEAALIDWQSKQVEHGLNAHWDALETNGFPYRLEIKLTAPSIEAQETSAPWGWSAKGLRAEMLPYDLNHVIVDIQSEQTFHYSQMNDGVSNLFLVNIQSDSAWASLVNKGDDEKRLSVDLTNVHAQRQQQTSEGPTPSGLLNAERLQLHARPSPGQTDISFDAAFRGENIHWTNLGTSAWPGNQIARLDIQARLSGLPQGLPGSLNTLLPNAAENGTKLAISDFTLQWGPIDMTGQGQITLDAEGRPEGTFKTSVGNLDGLITALVKAGIVTQQSAGLAFAGITALSHLQGEQNGRVRLPVAMKEGVLFLGPIAAARLEPLY